MLGNYDAYRLLEAMNGKRSYEEDTREEVEEGLPYNSNVLNDTTICK